MGGLTVWREIFEDKIFVGKKFRGQISQDKFCGKKFRGKIFRGFTSDRENFNRKKHNG